MTETIRYESVNGVTPRMKVAIETADRLANVILTDRHDVLTVILAKRLTPKTFEVIAEEEAELLGCIGATTSDVRKAIVVRVCNAFIAEPLHIEIKRELLLARPVHATTPAMLEALRANAQTRGKELEKYPWTLEIDQLAMQMASATLRENAPKKGYTDWKKVAEKMKNDHGIELTPKQWQGRVGYLRKMQADIPETIEDLAHSSENSQLPEPESAVFKH